MELPGWRVRGQISQQSSRREGLFISPPGRQPKGANKPRGLGTVDGGAEMEVSALRNSGTLFENRQ